MGPPTRGQADRPQIIDLGRSAMRRPRPPQLTLSDPEFGGRAQTSKAISGTLDTWPEPGHTEDGAEGTHEQTRAGRSLWAEPHLESLAPAFPP